MTKMLWLLMSGARPKIRISDQFRVKFDKIRPPLRPGERSEPENNVFCERSELVASARRRRRKF